MTNTPFDIEKQLINRMKERQKQIWKGINLNPYYRKGEKPEIVELNEKIKELNKIIK